MEFSLETPPCAVCGQWRRGQREEHHLTHGVSVWLCDTHRSHGYLQRAGGMDFAERIATVWASCGALTRRKRNALQAHLRALRRPPGRQLPGSYSWPALRREAERRFATGEDPNAVIADLRQTYADGPSMVPSLRTMRRWFSQARWIVAGGGDAKPSAPKPRRGPLTTREQLVNLMLSGYASAPGAPRYWVRGP